MMNSLIRFRSQAYVVSKELYQLKRFKRPDTRSILFILGCQRSGTSLMTRIFHRDWNTKVYFEDSNLSVRAGDEKLRLKPLPLVKELIEQERFPLIVLKPLVETQNAPQLLEYFPDSRAIWMYRHYKDVADSNLRKFGRDNGIRDIRYIAENRRDDWRVENVPERIRKIVLTYFSETMNPYDAAALFWYVRNSLFFELGLDSHPRVMICQYDELINHPKRTLQKMYAFANRPYAGDHILKMIHSSSLGRGRQATLSPEIERLCEELWDRMRYISAPAFIPG
ncbi:MAG TPA: sulfotransferase domain-containing protein [Anaerolineales bacterium]|nr:sulfotransferase domain-containing protein [Anaerolineales bacterium]